MNPVILHCDCNSFYASVESVARPELRDVPMAVCGDPESRHGVILAKNEAAKAFGIETAETVAEALRKCPALTLVAPHRKKYLEYSRKVNEIYARYTDLVEPFSIDESWLDVTGSQKLFGTGPEIAHAIKEAVKSELSITISIGVSYNKIFAKLGSDYKKPDAVTVITKENERDIVWPLPVSALMFVGGKSEERLLKIGITTIGQLAGTDKAVLCQVLGAAAGETLHTYACGLDDSPVRHLGDDPAPKSVGNSMTFKRNLVTKEDVSLGVTMLADSVAARLRKHHLKCTTIQLAIKNTNLKTIVRQAPITPTFLEREITGAALKLFYANWKLGVPVRMLAVTASGLCDENCSEQLNFLDGSGDERHRTEALEKSIDLLRGRYGLSAVRKANTLRPEELNPSYLKEDED